MVNQKFLNRKVFNSAARAALALGFAFAGIAGGEALPAQGRATPERDFAPRTKSVTLYPDRALVTRSASVQLQAGRQHLVYSGASVKLNNDSLRAFLAEDDPARNQVQVISVRSRLERRVGASNPEARRLETRIRELERKREMQSAAVARAELDLKNTESYAKYLNEAVARQSAGGSESGAARQWNEALAFLQKRRETARETRRTANESILRLDEELEIARGNLERIQSQTSRSYRVVEVIVQSEKPQTVELNLSYVIGDASWNVAYGMYLQNDSAGEPRLRVEYYGDVRQETGEDWTDAALSLSTARPERGAARERLRPLYLTARETDTRTTFEEVAAETVAEREEDGEGASETSSGTGGFAELESSGQSLLFRIPGRATIPSGKGSRRVTIARFDAPVEEIYYHLAPSQQRVAQLAVRARNARDFPLLAGPVDSFREAGFVGRGRLERAAPGESFRAGFGAERSIRIERNVKRERESAGAFSSDRAFVTRIETTLRNESDQARRIRLYEKRPVSETSQVRIETLPETDSGFAEQVEGSGILVNEIELTPRSERVIRLGYRVIVPENYPGEPFGD